MKLNYSFLSSLMILCTGFLGSLALVAQELYPLKLPDENWHGETRTLRYHPEGEDFVIVNGNRRFTRALYGTNTAFRVEAGDLPELALYMPGMGGNLSFGLIAGNESKWLNQAKKITARYRPGSMRYEIEDSLLGQGKLEIIILALADAEGFIVKTTFKNVTAPVELCWFFGGASGKKFSRNGDMGPDPESSFYLKPGHCSDNRFTIKPPTFVLKYGSVQAKKESSLIGFFPEQASMTIADASDLASPLNVIQSPRGKAPVLAGRLKVTNHESSYIALQNPESKTELEPAKAAEIFDEAEKARLRIADRVRIQTPDPYVNTVGGALSMASDAIWETPSYLHGAIGWRIRLNGWRGAYTADPLGWHDRARTHFRAYAKSQITSPEAGPVVPDTSNNLARQQEKLGNSVFTSGYISRDPEGKSIRPHHYDMNLVYIDALLWHLNWTGDLTFAREMWPVLQRHLAWEKRNFDPDNDGLYDAYAAIWASDALQYSGGSVTHTSAYNYRSNKMAATLARLLGENPQPYEQEADRILKAIQKALWMPEKGVYAEFKDALGLRKLHDVPALWSIYHTLDSEVPDAFQAYQSVRYTDTQIPHIPVRAEGLKDEGYYTLSTSNWMPYEWSINNVALAESAHLALANWEAGRTDEAFKLWKSELLASMYLGGSPGNFVQISHYDANRHEAYRDFGDPVGINSRTLVEGLFGIVPDALHDRLLIRPGLPSHWNSASITLPDLSYDFRRTGTTDVYQLIPNFPKKLNLVLRVKAFRENIRQVTVNGKKAKWKVVDRAVGQPVIEINSPNQARYEIRIEWAGTKPVRPEVKAYYVQKSSQRFDFGKANILSVFDPQGAFHKKSHQAGTLTVQMSSIQGNRTAFVELQQGSLRWWHPLSFQVGDAISVIPSTEKPSVIQIQNHTSQEQRVTYRLGQTSQQVTVKAASVSPALTIPDLVVGTNPLMFTTAPGDTLRYSLVNWEGKLQDKTQERINLTEYFNDGVTQIFRNQYLSPRPQTATLQLPTQGIGEWTHPRMTAEIDDSGLRKRAGTSHQFNTPQGITFASPGDSSGKNILFVSRWDNYPAEARLPLSGKASRAYLLMAGSTNPMQSRIENGQIEVYYTDGTAEKLTLRNPENWWPIEKDYFVDGFAFSTGAVHPPRLHLKTGEVIFGEKAKEYNGKEIEGGAATMLDIPLNSAKTLKELKLTALANDVVIGLMSITLVRSE